MGLHKIELIKIELSKIELSKIKYDFSICKISSIDKIDFNDDFCFVGKTDEEISLVCKSDHVPDNAAACDDGWKAFRIQGVLDFSLIGILAGISSILAENKIGIFVVSTYNTDYIMVKKENFERALDVLSSEGYTVL